jgi:sulfate transport system substrate-binding protein
LRAPSHHRRVATCGESTAAEKVDGWESRLPHHSQPYFSTIVFVVRRGNPKHIRDWPDLVAPDLSIITPDPKTSGNGKLSPLAAFDAALARGESEAHARDYLKAFYEHVQMLDPAARDSAITFAVQNIGDVHVTWEDEAREVDESKGELAIVYPACSILAEPHVRMGRCRCPAEQYRGSSESYLNFLFTDEAQETIAKLGFRPVNAEILKKYFGRRSSICFR